MNNLIAKAKEILDAGRFPECIAYCSDLLRISPNEPNVLFLKAIAASQIGDADMANRAFLAAVNFAPHRVDFLSTYGRFLRETDRAGESVPYLKRAVKLAPRVPATLHSLALSQLRGGEFADAGKTADRLLMLSPESHAAWEIAAAAAQRQGKVTEAIELITKGLTRFPNNARLHYSMAQLLRENCEFLEAARSYSIAEKHGYNSADLYRNRAEALLEGGSSDEALTCAKTGAARYPSDIALQRFAARLHHETGAKGDPVADLIAAARAARHNSILWQTAAELLNRLNRQSETHELLAECKRLGCPETPALAVLEAMDKVWCGQSLEATRCFETLIEKYPSDLEAKTNFVMHLLKAGDAERAESVCQQILAVNPIDQLALAYRGVALRLLKEEEEESWLLDYDRMVISVDVPVPDQFKDRETFFGEVREVLENIHRVTEQPIDQSLRGGTQTNGFLFRLKHPLIGLLEKQIRLAVVSAFDRFHADHDHPFLGKMRADTSPDDLRFTGAWSVRLQSQGFHSNHVHPEGWLSAVLYIALPEEVHDDSDESGFIQFGCPLDELGIELSPRRVVRPQVGTLVLFPSYMWHGTIPFTSDQPRITVACDILSPA